ncbi:MAG: helix-turn-helix transcriptional regulator [Balneolaceae bacterium]
MAYDKRQNETIWNEFLSTEPVDEKFINKQMQIAAQIDNYLKEKGWTQKQLAEKSALHPSQLSQILAAEANPTLRTLTNIEEALGKDIIVSPDFYEEDLEEKGWGRPVNKLSVSPDAFGTVLVEAESTTTVTQWAGNFQVKSKHFERAKVYQLKPTGS